MTYEESLDALLDACHDAKLFELTNCDEYLECTFLVLGIYIDIKYIYGGLRKEDFERVRKVLPSVKIIAQDIHYSTKYPYTALQMKSGVVFLTEDFPELEELKYVDQMKEIDEHIEKWLKTGFPFDSYGTYLFVRNPNNGREFDKYHFPKHHNWWNLWKGVTSINGIPLKEAKEAYKKEFPLRPTSP